MFKLIVSFVVNSSLIITSSLLRLIDCRITFHIFMNSGVVRAEDYMRIKASEITHKISSRKDLYSFLRT